MSADRARAPLLAPSAVALVAFAALAPARGQESPTPVFRDVTDQAGITFEHNSAPEKRYIVESMSGGVALLDVNGDGLLDIYFLNSLTVETAGDPRAARSALYVNRGDGRFDDLAAPAGVAFPGWGMGVCVADYDGDGRQDLYVTGVGANRLYRNQGDDTFTDVAEQAGVAADGWSTGCGFADYDRDGHLDLFVSRYVALDLGNLPAFGEGKTCQYRGIPVQCGPRGLAGTSDLLFRNRGDGRFDEVAKAAGVSDPDGHFGLGVAWFDADGDGWLDLYVANDSNANFLYLNQRDGSFREQGFPMGVAVSEDGSEQGGMGIAVGDYRNEGRESLFVTNFAEEYNALYHNGGDYFVDASFRSGSAPSSLPYVGWGTAFLDVDNDGWLDLIVVNGHVYPQLDDAKLGASAAYRQRKLLYRNRRDGTFEEIGERLGEAFSKGRVSRGLAVGDLDNDGRLDVVVHDLDGRPQLLRNETPSAGNWLLVDLAGRPPNTDAIGARVTVRIGERIQTRTVRSGTSYLSQDDLRLHFGLGDAPRVDRIDVLWPDGSATHRAGVDANQILVIAAEGPTAPPGAAP
ncbi:MAG TPA: CRTAC1 family protein [Thermoanaerobaculia bacterium]|nr:CRTAC1 family protein [Thermoanaerobaculia bacterium]